MAPWPDKMYFFNTSLIPALAVAFFLMISCRAQIRNSEQISGETYLLYGKEKKYTRKEIKKSISEKSDYKSRNDAAVHLIKSGNIEKGARILYSITGQSVKDKIPYLNLAKVLSIAGDKEKIQEIYDSMLNSGAVSESEAYRLAMKLYGEKIDTESYYLMHTLYRIRTVPDKNKIQYGFWLARFHMERAEFGNALNFFLEIIDLDESNSEALFSAGYIYSLGNDYVRAIGYLEIARKFGYAEPILLFHLAKCQYGSMNVNAALRTIESIPENKRNFEISSLHGDILLKIHYAADLSGILKNKNEKERILLLNHWYGINFTAEATTGDESDTSDANDKTSSRLKIDSARILRMLRISRREFQLHY